MSKIHPLLQQLEPIESTQAENPIFPREIISFARAMIAMQTEEEVEEFALQLLTIIQINCAPFMDLTGLNPIIVKLEESLMVKELTTITVTTDMAENWAEEAPLSYLSLFISYIEAPHLHGSFLDAFFQLKSDENRTVLADTIVDAIDYIYLMCNNATKTDNGRQLSTIVGKFEHYEPAFLTILTEENSSAYINLLMAVAQLKEKVVTLLLAKLLSAPFIDQSTIDRYFQLCQHLLAGNQIRPLQQFLRKSMYLFIAACYDPQAYGNFLLQLNEHRELLSIALTAKHENGISALIILAGEAPRLYLQLLTLLMDHPDLLATAINLENPADHDDPLYRVAIAEPRWYGAFLMRLIEHAHIELLAPTCRARSAHGTMALASVAKTDHMTFKKFFIELIKLNSTKSQELVGFICRILPAAAGKAVAALAEGATDEFSALDKVLAIKNTQGDHVLYFVAKNSSTQGVTAYARLIVHLCANPQHHSRLGAALAIRHHDGIDGLLWVGFHLPEMFRKIVQIVPAQHLETVMAMRHRDKTLIKAVLEGGGVDYGLLLVTLAKHRDDADTVLEQTLNHKDRDGNDALQIMTQAEYGRKIYYDLLVTLARKGKLELFKKSLGASSHDQVHVLQKTAEFHASDIIEMMSTLKKLTLKPYLALVLNLLITTNEKEMILHRFSTEEYDQLLDISLFVENEEALSCLLNIIKVLPLLYHFNNQTVHDVLVRLIEKKYWKAFDSALHESVITDLIRKNPDLYWQVFNLLLAAEKDELLTKYLDFLSTPSVFFIVAHEQIGAYGKAAMTCQAPLSLKKLLEMKLALAPQYRYINYLFAYNGEMYWQLLTQLVNDNKTALISDVLACFQYNSSDDVNAFILLATQSFWDFLHKLASNSCWSLLESTLALFTTEQLSQLIRKFPLQYGRLIQQLIEQQEQNNLKKLLTCNTGVALYQLAKVDPQQYAQHIKNLLQKKQYDLIKYFLMAKSVNHHIATHAIYHVAIDCPEHYKALAHELITLENNDLLKKLFLTKHNDGTSTLHHLAVEYQDDYKSIMIALSLQQNLSAALKAALKFPQSLSWLVENSPETYLTLLKNIAEHHFSLFSTVLTKDAACWLLEEESLSQYHDLLQHLVSMKSWRGFALAASLEKLPDTEGKTDNGISLFASKSPKHYVALLENLFAAQQWDLLHAALLNSANALSDEFEVFSKSIRHFAASSHATQLLQPILASPKLMANIAKHAREAYGDLLVKLAGDEQSESFAATPGYVKDVSTPVYLAFDFKSLAAVGEHLTQNVRLVTKVLRPYAGDQPIADFIQEQTQGQKVHPIIWHALAQLERVHLQWWRLSGMQIIPADKRPNYKPPHTPSNVVHLLCIEEAIEVLSLHACDSPEGALPYCDNWLQWYDHQVSQHVSDHFKALRPLLLRFCKDAPRLRVLLANIPRLKQCQRENHENQGYWEILINLQYGVTAQQKGSWQQDAKAQAKYQAFIDAQAAFISGDIAALKAILTKEHVTESLFKSATKEKIDAAIAFLTAPPAIENHPAPAGP